MLSEERATLAPALRAPAQVQVSIPFCAEKAPTGVKRDASASLSPLPLWATKPLLAWGRLGQWERPQHDMLPAGESALDKLQGCLTYDH